MKTYRSAPSPRTKAGISHRQEGILRFLRECPSATVRMIGEEVGLASTSSVWEHLRTLKKQGFIWRDFCDCCLAPIWATGKETVARSAQASQGSVS